MFFRKERLLIIQLLCLYDFGIEQNDFLWTLNKSTVIKMLEVNVISFPRNICYIKLLYNFNIVNTQLATPSQPMRYMLTLHFS